MKKIFTFFAAMLMSASLFAQWVKPVPQFEEMKDDGTEVQYLYNIRWFPCWCKRLGYSCIFVNIKCLSG